MVQEQESVESLKRQLKNWRALVKYLPEVEYDRDDIKEIEELIKLGLLVKNGTYVPEHI